MTTPQPVKIAALALLFVIALAGLASAQATEQGPGTLAPQLALGAGITYQGQILKDGAPVNGACDFRFRLFDSETGDVLVAPEVWKTSVGVVGGLFTVPDLSFGSSAFAGERRWLEVTTRCPAGSGSYVVLPNRQELTATPYAFYATNNWGLRGNAGTTPGTHFIGTTDEQALEFKVDGFGGLRIEPAGLTPNVVGGYEGNLVQDPHLGVSIGGGGDFLNECGAHVSDPCRNEVTGNFGTISGGRGHITDLYGTVGGGDSNHAAGWAAVGGGFRNVASGLRSTIGGGVSNTASGEYSTVAGGWLNTASGSYSFAAGQRAGAKHLGTLVWADSTAADFDSSGADQFLIRATGGVGIGTNAPATQLHVVRSVSLGAARENHVAVIENTSTGDSPDVLMLAVGNTNPTGASNFITFQDSAKNLGSIEGNGSGGIALNTSGGDFAEYLPAKPGEKLHPGDVVGLHAAGLSLRTSAALRVFVITTAPAVLGKQPPEGHENEYAAVALVGQAPVKVSGAVRAGDILVPSGRDDGAAVAVSLRQLQPEQAGAILGVALESAEQPEVEPVLALVGLPTDQALLALVRRQTEQLAGLEARLAALEAAVTAPTPVTGGYR